MFEECGLKCDQQCDAVQPDDCREQCVSGCTCPQVSMTKHFKPYSTGIDFRRQNLTSVDVRY